MAINAVKSVSQFQIKCLFLIYVCAFASVYICMYI